MNLKFGQQRNLNKLKLIWMQRACIEVCREFTSNLYIERDLRIITIEEKNKKDKAKQTTLFEMVSTHWQKVKIALVENIEGLLTERSGRRRMWVKTLAEVVRKDVIVWSN